MVPKSSRLSTGARAQCCRPVDVVSLDDRVARHLPDAEVSFQDWPGTGTLGHERVFDEPDWITATDRLQPAIELLPTGEADSKAAVAGHGFQPKLPETGPTELAE